ncbi:MAG: GNAT family N-acetyltransferase [Solirubrobacteraceae bacterium]|nr:GNAT family N-acetyltransferase [Solirubrobacteraceae bacterium]
MSGLEVRPARSRAEVDAALALRAAVFIDEQGVTEAEELDGRDGEAVHLVAVEDGAVVGTCRLLPAGTTVKLGRMAVAAEHRGAGIGARLLAEADRRAGALGAELIVLAAQLPAVPLYERAGYTVRGEVFDDAGIDHVRMEKRRA